ncbi:secretory subunit [Clonorchis sinensis]|uniref:Secretory subunit n=1 Tax=Clonorchis sinensis TaxID=79923 RepID=A0A8T1N1Y7_CLOSI|nr:secretory subunit [Clonorchis sinensis]
MAADHFEFDENGDTFLCFLVAFYTIILLPVTLFCWPTSESKDTYDQGKRKCMCQKCQVKRHYLKTSTPMKRLKKFLIKGGFLLAWSVFFLMIYKLTLIEPIEVGFDPFVLLEIDRSATTEEIRRAYKKLSLKYHPDKGGDPKRFISISKAYSALTDETSRKNWEEFGNPDGPGAARFGIALPKWMIEKENFYLVIGAYLLLFMLILPISVGTWWYNTVKFSSNKVLLDTVRYFHCAFMRSPRMSMVQVIEVLSNAYEFNPNFNKEVVSRPSDNVELPPLIKDIPIFTIFKKSIFGSPSSVKARALIYAHLLRLNLKPETLHPDRQYIVKNCPRLIEEMMNRLMSVLAIAMEEAGSRLKTPPYLHTIENCMHLVPMLIQAVPPCASPLLQLPHLTQTQLRHMEAKQRNLKTIRQFVRLPEDKRRNLLRNLSDEEYRDVLNVCASMPSLEISYRCEVLDDDDPSIWPFSIITATILLKRFPLFDPSAQPTSSSSAMGSGSGGAMGGAAMVGVSALSDSHYSGTAWSSDWSAYNPSPNSQLYPAADFNADNGSVTYGDFGEEDAGDCATSKLQKPATKPVWDKGKKKKPTRKNNKQRKQEQRRQRAGQPTVKGTDKGAGNHNSVAQDEETNSEMEEADPNPVLDEDKSGDALLTRRKNSTVGDQMPNNLSAFGDHRQETERDGDEHDGLADGHLLFKSNNVVAPRVTHSAGKQTTDRVNKPPESKPLHCSHVVHCPYFPMEKFEGWWVYVVDLMDRKTPRIITKPVYVATLQTEEEVALRFVAPANPGSYRYTLWVRSDSYVDCVFSDTLRFNVSSPPENVARYLQSLDEAHSDTSGSGSESDDERSDVDLSDGEADEGVNNSTEGDTDEEEATLATEDDSQANRLVSQCIS